MDELLIVLQNKSIENVLIDEDANGEYVPLVKKTVTYIVSGLLFNEDDEVLMMQEAKSSARGLWYLPAGRMEANETIEDAVKREVKEETGIICEPECLISVEMFTQQWFRFNMICCNKGGKLKAKADKESLQAKWFAVSDVLGGHNIRLRSRDITSVIRDAYHFFKNQENFLRIRPIDRAHQHLLMRVVVVFHDRDKSEYQVIFACNPKNHLPTFFATAGPASYTNFMKKLFDTNETASEMRSVLNVEHCGRPKHANDGVCITLLVHLSDKKIPEVTDDSKFRWMSIGDDGVRELLNRNLFEFKGVAARFLT